MPASINLNLRWKTTTLVDYLLAHPIEEFYALGLGKATDVSAVTATQFLIRLTEAGFLTDRWEPQEEVPRGRPRRHYFRFAPGGVLRLQQALKQWHANPRRQPPLSGG